MDGTSSRTASYVDVDVVVDVDVDGIWSGPDVQKAVHDHVNDYVHVISSGGNHIWR